jgi:5-methylthioadenosine/S-adenosylhomocysteine deaminase
LKTPRSWPKTCNDVAAAKMGTAPKTRGSSGAPGARLLVRDALILAVHPEAEAFRGYLLVGPDGRLAKVGRGAAPRRLGAAEVLDAGGRMVAPGFVSAHSHLFQSPLRGIAAERTLFGWLEAIGELLRRAGPEDLYWFCLHGAADFLRNGITSAYDFTYSGALGGGQDSIGAGEAAGGPPPDQEPYEAAQLRAKLDAGIRFVNSVSIVPAGSEEEIRARFARILAAAQDHRDHPCYLKSAISGWVQRAPDISAAHREARFMREFGLINQAHFLESPERVGEQRAKFDWYRKAGALGPGFIFGHFVQTTPAIIAAAAKAGARMCWQPLANGRLGSGLADIPAIRRAGIEVGLGLDDQSCSDRSDPFENMRAGLYGVRARCRDAAVLSVRDMLRMHTMGSAKILGLGDRIGSLEPGKFADFVVVDPRDPDTGPVHDPVATYVLACGLRNLKRVYVGGELAADGSALPGLDEAEIRRQVDRRMARCQRAAGR